MSTPRFLASALLALVTLTNSKPIVPGFHDLKRSSNGSLPDLSAIVAWNAAHPHGATPPGGEAMDIDEPGPSQPQSGDVVGGMVDPPGEASTRHKGKGKAGANPEDPTNALIRRYETVGRTQCNAWLTAPDTATSGQLMAHALGPSPFNDNWQRAGLGTGRDTRVSSLGKTWSGMSSDHTAQLAQNGGLGYLESAFSNLNVGNSPSPGQPEWQRGRHISSKLYTAPSWQGANVYFELTQDKDAVREKIQASNARYYTTFNVVDGVIIVHQNVPPTHAWLEAQATKKGTSTYNKPDSPFYSWSDLTWIMWRKIRTLNHDKLRWNASPFQWDPSTTPFVRGSGRAAVERYPFSKIMPSMNPATLNGAARSWLNWIVVTNIDDQDTINIMRQCMLSRGVPDLTNLDGHDDMKTFAAGTWCFYALMATESSKMVPEFLAQHRDVQGDAGLGHKMLLSVVLFSTRAAPGQQSRPALAWSITENGGLVQQLMSAFEEEWVCHLDEPDFRYAKGPGTSPPAGTPRLHSGSEPSDAEESD